MFEFIAKGVNYVIGNILQRKNLFLSGSLMNLDRKRTIDRNYFDYVRLSSLELISFEINKNKLSGNVAELGVYKGKFARYINQYFPDRKLYLFDTFAGFDERDLRTEESQSLSSGTQDFSDTSILAVLARMPFPDNCIPVKGFFPESAKGIDDEFVFVSLDADLYDPIYSGLTFFYPRLAQGGYIFIHDFNNKSYRGARRAVEEFCKKQNIGYTPLPDSSGSAIIAK